MISVIPAKAGIQRGRGACEPSHLSEIKYESRATNPFPLYGLAGVGFDSRHSREGGNPEGTRGLRAKSFIRNQVRIASDKSLPPLWGKAKMGARRAQARLCAWAIRPVTLMSTRPRARWHWTGVERTIAAPRSPISPAVPNFQPGDSRESGNPEGRGTPSARADFRRI